MDYLDIDLLLHLHFFISFYVEGLITTSTRLTTQTTYTRITIKTKVPTINNQLITRDFFIILFKSSTRHTTTINKINKKSQHNPTQEYLYVFFCYQYLHYFPAIYILLSKILNKLEKE
jgi:hypothetical protein